MNKYLIEKNKQGKVTLLRHVTMPKHVLFNEASIAIRCTEVSFPEGIKVKQKTKHENDDCIVKHFVFKETPFIVHYKLDAKYDPKSDIDVAGNLGTRKGPSNEEEHEAWLNQARSEKTELGKSENGQKLLAEYDKHQKAFNLAFTSNSFCKKWKEGGIAEAMARDTSDSLRTNTPVNTKSYLLNNNVVTYNYHAFSVKDYLLKTLIFIKNCKSMNPMDAPGYVSDDELTDSINAITNFVKQVHKTNNTSDQTTAMNRDQIYAAINIATEENSSSNENHDFSQIVNCYENKFKIEQNGSSQSYEDRYGQDDFYRQLNIERMMRSEDADQILHDGKITGVIPDNSFSMDILIKKTNGKSTEISVLKTYMPDCELNIDSEKWASEYKNSLEIKIHNVSFIKTYIMNTLQDGFEQIICRELANYENIHI